MKTKDLIEAVKFQVSVKPQDEFMAEIAEGLETLYEENNRQKAETERLKDSIKEADNYFSEGDFAKGLAIIINLVKETVGDEE